MHSRLKAQKRMQVPVQCKNKCTERKMNYRNRIKEKERNKTKVTSINVRGGKRNTKQKQETTKIHTTKQNENKINYRETNEQNETK